MASLHFQTARINSFSTISNTHRFDRKLILIYAEVDSPCIKRAHKSRFKHSEPGQRGIEICVIQFKTKMYIDYA